MAVWLFDSGETNQQWRGKKKKRILVLYSSIYLTINATDVFADVFAIILFVKSICIDHLITHHRIIITWRCLIFQLLLLVFPCSTIINIMLLKSQRSNVMIMLWLDVVHIFRQHFFPLEPFSSFIHIHTLMLGPRWDSSLKTCQMAWINRWTKLLCIGIYSNRFATATACFTLKFMLVHGHISTRNWLLHINSKWVSISNWISSFVSVILVIFFPLSKWTDTLISTQWLLKFIFNPTEKWTEWVRKERRKKWLMSLTLLTTIVRYLHHGSALGCSLLNSPVSGFEKDASYRFVSQIIIEENWKWNDMEEEKKMVRRPRKSSTGIPALIDWEKSKRQMSKFSRFDRF